jgi:hypothetical protein
MIEGRIAIASNSSPSFPTCSQHWGLITRERNPDDRREYLLRLTPEGHQQLATARAIVDQAHQRLARQLGNAEAPGDSPS